MTTVSVANEITGSVEHVFKQFTDIERSAERVSSIKAIEMLTPSGFELGARWRETREVLGQLDTAEMEVTSYEKNRGYTITHHKGGVRIDTVFRFESVGQKTRVSIEFGFDPQGMPPGLLAPLEWVIAGKVRDVLQHDLDDLKGAVERK